MSLQNPLPHLIFGDPWWLALHQRTELIRSRCDRSDPGPLHLTDQILGCAAS
ncbi:hypothetical protein [Xanthomonas phaseoli]|uniref:Uncharacterized protein n=1 Tax=Xanthomonas manihotis TaxID=43353 RepID=A0A8I1XTN9_XANMN|nr:hypothetical protein [Xanthomonas phaseoli]MBO9721559.1 hypothetical protein [Xanthomonas phaseoli pv. manihotis]MBO9756379.1 hypothetical protein [Xanthomonas phaseoli pv. manihotis]MBO9761724.1 hypothetical protein [Xanthomonas phaseoli pv. manihotis]MBO9784965.1 hypothetical protein [Xanthomonas phaseoli pv. manihotis]MCC8534341.1 hypothetical protein [Xanthomonas phaseoli]